ncbi:hypothetical protein GGI17_006823, partial [Coemansia sp. S146]
MTPAKPKGEGAYCEHDPATLNRRREKLVRDLKDKGYSLGFMKLLIKLGLADAYKAYLAGVPADAFKSLVNDSLVVSPTSAPDALEGKLHTVDSLSSKRHKLEAVYVDTFKRLLDALSAKAKESTLPSEYQSTPYRCEDFQADQVDGSKLKPDLLFFQINNTTSDISTAQLLFEAKRQMEEKTAYGKYLGQFADYALEVWKAQPLRTFVPLLLLLGCDLYLVVFTRNGYYKTNIGQVMFRRNRDIPSLVSKLQAILHTLWFLLTLPASNIGQLDNSTHPFDYVDMTSIAGQAILEV